MTNFEYITEDRLTLSKFIEKVQNDALEAVGCAFKLHYPPDDVVDWYEWLGQEED